MRRVMSIVLVVVTALFSTPAAPKDKSIVIVANPTRLQWAKKIGRNLNDAVRYPHPVFGHDSRGLVSVVFVPDEHGVPSAVQLVRASRYPELNRAALEGVSRLKTMYPKPQDVGDRQRIRANILFATSVQDYEAQLADMRAEAKKHHVQSALDRDTLVLDVTGHSAGGFGR